MDKKRALKAAYRILSAYIKATVDDEYERARSIIALGFYEAEENTEIPVNGLKAITSMCNQIIDVIK